MGASASNESKAENKIKRTWKNNFEGKKNRYNFIHDNFEMDLIVNEFYREINNMEVTSPKKLDKLIYDCIDDREATIKKYPILKSEVEDLLYETITSKMVSNHMLIRDYCIFKTLPFLFEYIYKDNKDEIEDCKTVLKIFEKEFDNKMLSVVYDIRDHLSGLSDKTMKGIHRNLKFNKEFQVEILNIILTPELFEREEVISDLCELIRYGPELKILTIIINPVDSNNFLIDNFCLNISNHNMLFEILDACLDNRRIKGLFIQCLGNTVVLSPENTNLIIKKIQSESLIAFSMGGICITKEFSDVLGFQLMNTRKMIYLGIDYKLISKILMSKLLPNLAANISLKAIAFSGFDMKNERNVIDKFIKEITKENPKILALYLGGKSLVTYPFNPVEKLTSSKTAKKTKEMDEALLE